MATWSSTESDCAQFFMDAADQSFVVTIAQNDMNVSRRNIEKTTVSNSVQVIGSFETRKNAILFAHDFMDTNSMLLDGSTLSRAEKIKLWRGDTVCILGKPNSSLVFDVALDKIDFYDTFKRSDGTHIVRRTLQIHSTRTVVVVPTCAAGNCLDAPVFACSRCFTKYCSAACQHADWPQHKRLCKVPQSESGEV